MCHSSSVEEFVSCSTILLIITSTAVFSLGFRHCWLRRTRYFGCVSHITAFGHNTVSRQAGGEENQSVDAASR